MTRTSPDPSFPKNLKWCLAVYFACFLAVYFILHLKYRIAELDDTWWLTYAYNFLHRHITYDLFAGSDLLGAGIQSFGKTYAFLIGVLLDLLGWTKPNAYGLSLAFVGGGFTAWYFTLRRIGYSRGLSATFCVTGLLLDPFFSAALSARAEAFVFFVSSAALLLFVRKRYFGAMALAWVGLETHPTGAVAFFLMAAAFWAEKRPDSAFPPVSPRALALTLAGFGAGALYYLFLHADHLAQLPQNLLANNRISWAPVQNFIFEYYFLSKYHRHLAELALLLFCSWKFLRNKYYLTDSFVLPLALSLLLFTFVIRRPNYHYPLFFYPAFLLMVAKVFEVRWNLSVLTLGLLGLLLPQYAYAYYLNRDYKYDLEIQFYRNITPRDSLPILGSPGAWFAFPDREIYFNRYSGDIEKLGLTRFYLLKEKGDNLFETRDFIRTHFKSKPLGEFTMGRWEYVATLEEVITRDQGRVSSEKDQPIPAGLGGGHPSQGSEPGASSSKRRKFF